jgi:hypothetical protein
MARFEEPYEDIESLFDEVVVNQSTLPPSVNIKLLADNKSKKIFKVMRANDLLKYRTGDDVIIIINQNIFEQLTDVQKMIVAEEAVAYIAYDMDKDKVLITEPDFLAHSGILRKHTFEVIENVRETIKSLYDAENQAEDESLSRTGR